MSEYERAKRMSEFYFDVDGWQKQREQEQEEEEAEGKKRKRPSKKDLVSSLWLTHCRATYTHCRRGSKNRRNRRRLQKLHGFEHERMSLTYDTVNVFLIAASYVGFIATVLIFTMGSCHLLRLGCTSL